LPKSGPKELGPKFIFAWTRTKNFRTFFEFSEVDLLLLFGFPFGVALQLGVLMLLVLFGFELVTGFEISVDAIDTIQIP
jgi:hypothetical protein